MNDGSFNRWFYEMNPQISRVTLIFATGLLAATLVYFRRAIAAAKIVLSEERALRRRRDAYWSFDDSCEIRLAYCVPKPLFPAGYFAFGKDGIAFVRALVPEDRVISRYGWDSDIVAVFEKAIHGSFWSDSDSRALFKRLRERGALPQPPLLPKGIAGDRRIWAVDLQMDKQLGAVTSKSYVMPCVLPAGDLSNVLPLPQFLIHDFRELDQELRKKYKQGAPIFEQIIQDPNSPDPIEEFVTYLKCEDRRTYSRQEAIIFDVFELELAIRGMGIESAIASLTCRPGFDHLKRFEVWVEGLKAVELEEHYQEAKKIPSYLEYLKSKFGEVEDWEYDDVDFEVCTTFPEDIKYMEIEAFDVGAVLLEFAMKNKHLLLRISHPALSKSSDD